MKGVKPPWVLPWHEGGPQQSLVFTLREGEYDPQGGVIFHGVRRVVRRWSQVTLKKWTDRVQYRNTEDKNG